VTPLVRKRNAPSTEEFPFFFEPAHVALAERAREFAMNVARPEADLHRRQAAASYEVLGERCKALALRLAKERLIDACIPAAYGGLTLGDRREQLDVRSICLLRETLAWSSALAEFVLAMQGLGSYPIVVAGNDDQRKAFLPPVLRGESLAAFAVTEPEAGSDVAAMRTTADRRKDVYVINGRKTFISNAGIAGQYIVFAKTDPAAASRGISAFIVKDTDPGFHFDGPQTLMTEHPVGSIRFEELTIPANRRLGREGDGFKLAMKTLDTFRTTVGAAACGMARRALDEALFRATTREQFGKPIADNQLVQGLLANMATDLDAARLLVYRAAYARDKGIERVSIDSSMAKYFATETAQRVIDGAVQLHGGAGVLRGVAVEQLYRDIRALRIYEGTSEIHQVIIARVLMGAERARQQARSSGLDEDARRETMGEGSHADTAKTQQMPAVLAPPTSAPQRPTPNQAVVAANRSHDPKKTLPDTPAAKLFDKRGNREDDNH
jgi:acyl-CoA dehydrogenase